MSLVLSSIAQSDKLNSCCVLLDNGHEYTGKCSNVAKYTTLCNPKDKFPLVSYNIGHIYCEEHKSRAYGPLYPIPETPIIYWQLGE